MTLQFLAVITLFFVAAGSVRADEGEPALQISSLVEEALSRNPELLAASRSLERMRARIPQAGALADPLLSYGVMNEGRPIPFETLGDADFSELYVGVSQDIPYPGKRRLREAVTREEAEKSRWALESVRRQVVARVKETYYELYFVHAGLDTVRRSLKLLESVEKTAAARFAVGEATQQDVLDSQVELSRLEERLILLEKRRQVAEEFLRSLLGRSSKEPLGRPQAIHAIELRYEMEELWQMAEEASPALGEGAQSVAAGESSLELARREQKPDFGASFVYHNRGGLPPYYTFGGTVSLPLYAGRKQKQAIVEATEGLTEMRHGLDAVKARLRYEITDAYLTAKTAERLLALYDGGLLKQARFSLDSAAAQYQVGRIDFLTLLQSWSRLLDYDLTYHEQIAEHEKGLARLEAHVGIELTGR